MVVRIGPEELRRCGHPHAARLAGSSHQKHCRFCEQHDSVLIVRDSNLLNFAELAAAVGMSGSS